MEQLTALDQRTGTDITKSYDADEVIHQAGFDFEVETVPVHDPEGSQVLGRNLLRRSDTKQVFGVVGNRYQTVPIADMFKPFHRMVEQYGATYETAGLIGGGRKCWASAVLPDTFKLKGRPEDEIQKRIMVLISNDGTSKNSYMSIANRIFCNNQINLISRRHQQSNYKVGHTSTWEEQLVDAQLGFDSALSLHKEFEYMANELNSKKMSEEEMRGFSTQLFPHQSYEYQKKEKDKEKIKRSLDRLNIKREEVVTLFKEGRGNVGATRWDALNAVTEYLDHHKQASRLNNEKTGAAHAEKRFVSNVIRGSGNSMKQRAITLLSDVKKFKKVEQFA